MNLELDILCCLNTTVPQPRGLLALDCIGGDSREEKKAITESIAMLRKKGWAVIGRGPFLLSVEHHSLLLKASREKGMWLMLSGLPHSPSPRRLLRLVGRPKEN